MNYTPVKAKDFYSDAKKCRTGLSEAYLNSNITIHRFAPKTQNLLIRLLIQPFRKEPERRCCLSAKSC